MIIAFILLTGLICVGLAVTGAILSALFWVCVKLPASIIVMALGFALCCTLLLIPVGLKLFKFGIMLLLP